MHDVVLSRGDQFAEGQHPPEVRIVTGSKGVNRRSKYGDRGHKRVLLPVHVRHLVLDAFWIGRGHRVHQEPLGTSVTEALDDLEDLQWSGWPRPGSLAHREIVPTGPPVGVRDNRRSWVWDETWGP